ncbi:MAG: DEAD/DEAH box helicase [Crocinitomicaceae bacterium]|nr:DEAD/DEAH box helicase [Crocinitomicaceae bacterium]
MKFSEIGLRQEILEGIEAMRFDTPTPIQEQAVPIILEGKDLIGIAQTGTGKTAAFVLPVLNKLLEMPYEYHTKALIVVPTRELALQIDQAVEAYSYYTGASSIAIYGGGDGADFTREKNAIEAGVDIIIATPGRLLSHINLGYVNFSKLNFLILDEADRMLNMGFYPDLMRIIRHTNPERQSLLFSATMPDEVFRLAKQLLRSPETVNIALSKPADGVEQGAYIIFSDQKIPLVSSILTKAEGKSVIVFASTRQNVSKLFNVLHRKGLNVGQISSDLEQTERERMMLGFRNRQIDILVATDVVSRGIDVDGIDLVINFDVPVDAEDYVHRVGRTARAAKKGSAITLVSTDEQNKFRRIETLIGAEINKLEVSQEFGPTPLYDPGSKKKEKRRHHSKQHGRRGPKKNHEKRKSG